MQKWSALEKILFGLSPKVAASIAGISILLLVEITHDALYQVALKGQNNDIVRDLSTIKARLEGELYSNLLLTRGLETYASIRPDLSQREFDLFAAELIRQGEHIRNIALAPDNILTFIYPIEGNEAALGLDYEQTPTQWPEVEKAILANKTVVAGPLNLVQGGSGIIARTPIFTSEALNHDQQEEYWGISSIVLDADSLMFAAGMQNHEDSLKLALRGKNGLGAEGDIFYGSQDVFSSSPVTLSVPLPLGEWQIAAIPADGWQGRLTYLWWLRAMGWGFAGLVSALTLMLVRERKYSNHLALHDVLTGLPNRRKYEESLKQAISYAKRYNIAFSLMFIDLNKFKPINDRYGHDAGDALLKTVAERMRANLRDSDLLCRVGGDEFVLLLPNNTDEQVLRNIAHKLFDAMTQTVHFEGNELQIHASIGVARYPDDAEDIIQLEAKADDAMYQAKRTGSHLAFARDLEPESPASS